MRRSLLVAVAVAAVVISGAAVYLGRQEPSLPLEQRPLPRSMAAIGDSITQAVAVDRDALGAAPEHSWATGTDPDDIVSSHAERLTAAGALDGGVYNNSLPGARVSDVVAQATSTVEQNVDYVVILIGANDVCAIDSASMTSVDSFRTEFQRALQTLSTGLPRAAIFVGSIPNIYRLWEIGTETPAARLVWDAAGICRSVLSDSISEDARRAALERLEAFNAVLEEVCRNVAGCRFDDGAVFDHGFSADDLGPLDYFHPSIKGQADLAEVTWAASFWPDL